MDSESQVTVILPTRAIHSGDGPVLVAIRLNGLEARELLESAAPHLEASSTPQSHVPPPATHPVTVSEVASIDLPSGHGGLPRVTLEDIASLTGSFGLDGAVSTHGRKEKVEVLANMAYRSVDIVFPNRGRDSTLSACWHSPSLVGAHLAATPESERIAALGHLALAAPATLRGVTRSLDDFAHDASERVREAVFSTQGVAAVLRSADAQVREEFLHVLGDAPSPSRRATLSSGLRA